MTPSSHVFDTDATRFNTDVIVASNTTPIVIDFWADWCAPCRQLGPDLEVLAQRHGGGFRLAKVNTDLEPELAQTFGIRSLPTVVALFQGQMVDHFMGALPMPELERWLASVLERCGVAPPKKELPTTPVAAEAHWRRVLQETPTDGEALLGLGRLLLLRGAADEARETLGKVEASADQYGAAQSALATLGLMEQVAAAGGVDVVRERLASDPDDPRARYLAACADASAGELAVALETLVALVERAPEDVRTDAKAAAATVFAAAARGDERIEALRRKLTRLLF